MIQCGRCEVELGEVSRFGFLVCDEKNDGKSYHFVLDQKFMEEYEKTLLSADNLLLKGLYYIVNCKSCESDIGKKFIGKQRTRYIAFGKEKLIYDGVKMKKTDKWTEHLDAVPFNAMKRFQMTQFMEKKAFRAESESSRETTNKQAGNSFRGGSSSIKQSGIGGNNSLPAKLQRGHTTPEIPRQKPAQTRDKIGTSISEKVKFLSSKRQSWPADQLVYEFCGPHLDNWTELIKGLNADLTGELMREVFILLSKSEIRIDPRNAPLYIPLTTTEGVSGLTYYVLTGPLSDNMVNAASKPGGPSWVMLLDHALRAVMTIDVLMSKFIEFRSIPFVGLIVEKLSTAIDKIVGSDFLVSREIVDWCPLTPTSLRNQYLNDCTHLAKSIDHVKEVQRASTQNNLASAQHKIAADKQKEDTNRLAKQSARLGLVYLDDPERDVDYLTSSVIPKAEELIGLAPAALPKNIISDKLVDESDEYKPQKSNGQHSMYRSTDHYLNTHFQLVKEDCLAQLRRGVFTFRDLLGAKSNADTIDGPTADALRSTCVKFSRGHGGDSGAYLYRNISVHSVERMPEDIGYIISFEIAESRKIDWKNSKRFMKGSLLCMSPDGTFNAASIVVATVLRSVQEPSGLQQINF